VKIWISRAMSKVSDVNATMRLESTDGILEGVYREETDSREKQEGNIRVMYQFHETTPLKVAEVPKGKPELEVLETILTCTIR
jgi:hypothetical protein